MATGQREKEEVTESKVREKESRKKISIPALQIWKSKPSVLCTEGKPHAGIRNLRGTNVVRRSI